MEVSAWAPLKAHPDINTQILLDIEEAVPRVMGREGKVNTGRGILKFLFSSWS